MPQTFIQEPNTVKRKTFIDAYLKTFKPKNNRIDSPVSAAQGYDSVYLLAAAIKQAGTTEGPKVREALENLQTKVEGVVTTYDKPFTHDDHEAITANIPIFGEVKGSKVVCGVGPVLQELQSSYDDVRWLGVLDRRTLAKVYAAADVFVFPSLNETFGLVMLEAMSTGTPVAAFPVDGPLQVLEKKDDAGKSLGGALDKDQTLAVEQALQIDRSQARQRALDFDWQKASHLFQTYLVQCHQPKLPL